MYIDPRECVSMKADTPAACIHMHMYMHTYHGPHAVCDACNVPVHACSLWLKSCVCSACTARQLDLTIL